MQKTTAKHKFQKINLISIILLFVLILAGGVVRSTGSGMGCPDWPKCFGRFIPPVSADQLPENYKQKYVDGRVVKNERFANTLDVFGYSDLANRLREDKSILVPEEFNVARTWTEYVNRLVGATSGIFLLLMAVYSFAYTDKNKLIPFLSVFNLILIGFQAWLGSIVVSTNLVAWIITIHLLLALAILAICIATYHLAKTSGRPALRVNIITYIVAAVALLLSIGQITLGAEVRERIDAIATRLQDGYRSTWIVNAGKIFTDHRDLALLVLIVNIVLYILIRRGFSRHSIQQQVMSFSFLMVVLQIVSGIALAYLALPPAAQASHIVLASLLFGAQFYLFLNLFRSASLHGGHQ